MSILRAIRDKITAWLGHKALDFAMSSLLKSLGIPNTPEVQAAIQRILSGVLVLAAAYQGAKTPEEVQTVTDTATEAPIEYDELSPMERKLADKMLAAWRLKHPLKESE